MKAISLKQPWASLIVSGRKTIELRTWNTKFRGEFYIHASKTTDGHGNAGVQSQRPTERKNCV